MQPTALPLVAIPTAPLPKCGEGFVLHRGGCHCGDVRFEFCGGTDLQAWDCNCSVCAMRKNIHVMVPADRFRLLTDAAAATLTQYTFGTHTARHLFCKRCGITAFYIPRSNPDGFGVTAACIDQGTVRSLEVCAFDGVHWEEEYAKTGIAAQTATVQGATRTGRG